MSRWLRDAAGVALGAALWVITWIFPVTFMIFMAWGCESHTRRLFRGALELYSEGTSAPQPAADQAACNQASDQRRRLVTRGALALSIAIPVGFIISVVHRNAAGLNLLTATAVLIAISLVIATAVVGSRR